MSNLKVYISVKSTSYERNDYDYKEVYAHDGRSLVDLTKITESFRECAMKYVFLQLILRATRLCSEFNYCLIEKFIIYVCIGYIYYHYMGDSGNLSV